MPLESKSAYPAGVVVAVSVEPFIQTLADSRLMTADELHGFLAALSPDAVKRF